MSDPPAESPSQNTPLDYETPRAPRRFAGVGKDVAYILPMAVFLLFTWAGVQWPALYAASYVIKTILAAFLLAKFWPLYTRINWNHWRLGLVMGVAGIVQWVGTERLLLAIWPHFPEVSGEPRNLLQLFHSRGASWSFIALRWAGAVLVVPVMEELFWRDFLWRSVAAPADFTLASVGEWDRGIPLLAVSLAFCVVHPQWLTAIIWGLMIGWVLIKTRSLGACIIMHATTNLLLGAYVLYTGDWRFW